jgi:hypothetical protein
LVTWVVHGLIGNRLARRSALAATGAVAVSLAIATECLQIATGRDAQVLDVGFDLLGASAALTLLAGRTRVLPQSLALGMATALIVVSLAPALIATQLSRRSWPLGHRCRAVC